MTLPRAFVRYVLLTAALAAVALTVVALQARWHIGSPPLFWLLVALVIVAAA